MTIVDLLARRRVVPVVVVQDPREAKPLAEALRAGGLPLAEITFRTSAAPQTLAAMAEDPAMIVGAGTVISADQVDTAVDAGARFVVSPGFSAVVVRRCHELGVPVVPGVATATDLMAALDAGITTVKLFLLSRSAASQPFAPSPPCSPRSNSSQPEGSQRPTRPPTWQNRPCSPLADPGWSHSL